MLKYFPKYKNITHRESLLFSFMYSYVAVISLSFLIALITDEYASAVVHFLNIVVVIYALIYYEKTKDYQLVSLIWLWNAGVIVFAHAIINKFSIDIAGIPLIIICASILLSRKNLILHGKLFFISIVILFIYGYLAYPKHHFLSDVVLVSSFFIVVLFSIVFAFIYHIFIEHSYKELEESNKQKEILLQEVHHRVKNNLNMMSSILGLQCNSRDEKTLHIIESNRRRIESIAMVHELLYDNKNFKDINFYKYAHKLSTHLVHACSSYNIDIKIDANNITLSLDTMAHIGLLLQELLTNSLKHAFNGDGEINISLIKENDEYILQYSDSGKSTNPDKDKDTLGLELISLKVQQLDGKIELDKDDKYKYKIRFKNAQL